MEDPDTPSRRSSNPIRRIREGRRQRAERITEQRDTEQALSATAIYLRDILYFHGGPGAGVALPIGDESSVQGVLTAAWSGDSEFGLRIDYTLTTAAAKKTGRLYPEGESGESYYANRFRLREAEVAAVRAGVKAKILELQQQEGWTRVLRDLYGIDPDELRDVI